MAATPQELLNALAHADASVRLRAALAIGSGADAALLDALLERCAVEPDFYVRDMLTWALTRYPPEATLPRLLAELHSDSLQARSQALHTLSKVRIPDAYPAITPALLRHPDDEVARSAWRAAVVLVPDRQKRELAEELATQLGRGGRELKLSLSRALIALGEEVITPVLAKALAQGSHNVREHANATERLLRDPDAGFDFAVNEARRRYVLGGS